MNPFVKESKVKKFSTLFFLLLLLVHTLFFNIKIKAHGKRSVGKCIYCCVYTQFETIVSERANNM